MAPVDPSVLAERLAALDRHLDRVADQLPDRAEDGALADRLVRAVGFRNLVVHAYADVDLLRVHAAATDGPADLRAFTAALLRAEGLAPS
jgi:uncharacterized protein with HEPN domain